MHIFFCTFRSVTRFYPSFPSHGRERDLGLYKPGMVVADWCPA